MEYEYICGHNSFTQIDSLLASVGNEQSKAESQLFCVLPQKLARNLNFDVVACTWSDIWAITETGRVSCYGNNSERFPETDKCYNCVIHTKDVTLLQTLSGNVAIYQNVTGNLKPVTCGENVRLVAATKDTVYGISGTSLCDCNSQDFTTEECITFSRTLPTFSVVSVACGFEHTLVLTTSGCVYSCGSSSRGQLGHGEVSVDMVQSPRIVHTLEGVNIVHIAAGGWHSTAVSDSGDLYVWGWNESGQLGLPNSSFKSKELRLAAPADTRPVDDNTVAVLVDTAGETQGGSCDCVKQVPTKKREIENTEDFVTKQLDEHNKSDTETNVDKEDSCTSTTNNEISFDEISQNTCESTGEFNEESEITGESKVETSDEKVSSCKPFEESKIDVRNTVSFIDKTEVVDSAINMEMEKGSAETLRESPKAQYQETFADQLHERPEKGSAETFGKSAKVLYPDNVRDQLHVGPEKGSAETLVKSPKALCQDNEGSHFQAVLGKGSVGTVGDFPEALYQDIGACQIQVVPYGLDIPDDMTVKKVACGSRHTCLLMDSGILMTAGWNKYGQLCLGDTQDRCCLATVSFFWKRGEIVTDVFAQSWNTFIRTRVK